MALAGQLPNDVQLVLVIFIGPTFTRLMSCHFPLASITHTLTIRSMLFSICITKLFEQDLDSFN